MWMRVCVCAREGWRERVRLMIENESVCVCVRV